LGWTLIRKKPIEEIFKELKETGMEKELKNSLA